MRLAIIVLLLLHQVPSRTAGAIAGWWHGTSTCIRAKWNRACNDEVVVYEFVPMTRDSTRLINHAYKIVSGQRVPMGDLEFVYSPATKTWDADFANSRVNIRWTFEIKGDTLVGRVVLRPDMRVGRRVVATRGEQ